ncbi:AAA family ATPase [Crossiella cryophila]|uniref:ATPase dynein-related AAA domain-containing protein n=1 Tax=Crossiella cryophila TaxID=43355 RepID=A0A7W7FXY4_9PSEU|nr:AAA family ATPase [Crossiella cryophila]MBB4681787.1 hypothetical protein [Crossiella cryophila]
MNGIKYLVRRRKAKALWRQLHDSSAWILDTTDTSVVELTASFTSPCTTAPDTTIRILIHHGQGELAKPEFALMYQPTGIGLYCAECPILPCAHHQALLEAGTQLDGQAGAAVREAVDNIAEFTLGMGEPSAADFADEHRLVFFPASMRWQKASSALVPIQVPPLRPPARWSRELGERVPDPCSLTDAVTNEAVEQQLENLTALGRRVFLLAGPSGTGKSATLARIAANRGVPYLTINTPEQIELFRIGLEGGATVLHHSLLVEAIQHPCVIELVDLHRWADRMDVLDAIEPLLNPTAARLQAYYPITGGAIDVAIDPRVLIAGTTNRPSVDFGAKWLERWTVLPVTQLHRDCLARDAYQAGARVLQELVHRGLACASTLDTALEELEKFADLTARTACLLNRNQVLAARYSWGSRAVREAVERRAFGEPANEIAVAVFAGKLPRDPALALHALSLVHGLEGWGTPKVSHLPFSSLVSDQQLQAAFPEIGGTVE